MGSYKKLSYVCAHAIPESDYLYSNNQATVKLSGARQIMWGVEQNWRGSPKNSQNSEHP